MSSVWETVQVQLGWIGWFVLICFPGLWVTFGFSYKTLPFGMKLLGGVMLSPLVIVAQFYFFRLAGVPFEETVYLLPIVNLPAALLVWRNRGERPAFEKEDLLLIGIAAALVAISLAPHVLSVEARVFSSHPLTHTDIVYQLANGALRPEEPELAGVKLAYPWAGHVVQSVLSFIIDSPPAVSYIWTNLFWALCAGLCASYIVRELGGNRFARLTAPIWLYFGLNVTGYVLQKILPSQIAGPLWIGGDYRYTPWILKFFFFEQIIFGLGMMSMLIYVTLRSQSSDDNRALNLLKFFLLVGIGILYPILIAPAILIIVARIVVDWFKSREETTAGFLSKNLTEFLVLAGAGLITGVTMKLVTAARVTPAINWPRVSRYFLKYTSLKTLGTVIAVSLMIAAFAYVYSRVQNDSARLKMLFLGLSSVLILALNIALELPFYGNEYKFILAAALCLAPFPALALERLGGRSSLQEGLTVAILAGLLYLPLFQKLRVDYPWYSPADPANETAPWPRVNTDSFDLRLSEDVEMSALCEAIRLETPLDTVVMMEATEIHLPSFSQRSVFISPDFEGKRPGVNLSSSELLTEVRGYGEAIFNDRKKILANLYRSSDQNEIRRSMESIRSLNRPLAIVIDPQKHASLLELLRPIEGARPIYTSPAGHTVWLLPAERSST